MWKVRPERKIKKKEEGTDLTQHEHERALNGSYRSFMIPGTPKADIDSYLDQTKPHIKTLIKNELKEMGSAKIIMTLRVIWWKPIKLLIDPEDLKDAVDKGRPVPLVSPSPQEMDEFEKEEMKKSRFLVKNKLNEWYDCLADRVPKRIKNAADRIFLELKKAS